MTLKTPEQIADEIAALPEFAILTEEDLGCSVEIMMARAIEADRAQRAAALDALRAWAVDVSDSMSTDKCNDWSEELTRLVEIERKNGLGGYA